MWTELITISAVLLFIVLILIEVPVAFALTIAGALGIAILAGPHVAFSTLASEPYAAVAAYDLLVLPMFVLLGAIVGNAGIATRIFEAANSIVGRMPGGLGVTTVLACTIFGGISGSSVADAATLGRVSIFEMRRHGYSAGFSAGLVAASAMIAILIPPSIPLVVYGLLTGVPIGSLLLAGIIPGLLTCVVFSLYVIAHSFLKTRKSASRTNSADSHPAPRDNPSMTRKPASFIGLIYAAILFTVVVGGIYSGILTSTEAAAAGAFAACVIAIPIALAEKRKVLPMMGTAIMEAARTSAMIFALLVGSAIFTYFLAYGQVPDSLVRWATSLNVSPSFVVICVLLILVPLGMFLDGLSMLLLIVPVAYPVVQQMGVDGVWFGVLVVTMIELGLITPPVGMNVYVVTAVAKDVKLEEVFLGVTPFLIIQVLITALIFMFPTIATFLPEMAAGTW